LVRVPFSRTSFYNNFVLPGNVGQYLRQWMKRRAKDQLLACVAVDEAIAQEHLNHDVSLDCLVPPFALAIINAALAESPLLIASQARAMTCAGLTGSFGPAGAGCQSHPLSSPSQQPSIVASPGL
jgi:hypothetical protein